MITDAVITRIECEKKESSIFTNCENTAENHMRILGHVWKKKFQKVTPEQKEKFDEGKT